MPSFVIIIPSYNNSLWYKKNLDSVLDQDYDTQCWRVIYIDDASPDNTGQLVEKYIAEHKHKDISFTLIKNSTRRYKLANFYTAAHTCLDTEIIVELDGDDWFADNHVLSFLAEQYRNPATWLTYGNHEQEPKMGRVPTEQLPEYVIAQNTYRNYFWVTSALRTYYAWLFKQIKLQDLLYSNQFFTVAADCAYMFPMLEMAGTHSIFIEKVLYIYNLHTALNDFKINTYEQQQCMLTLRSRTPYKPYQHPVDFMNLRSKTVHYRALNNTDKSLRAVTHEIYKACCTINTGYILLTTDTSNKVQEQVIGDAITWCQKTGLPVCTLLQELPLRACMLTEEKAVISCSYQALFTYLLTHNSMIWQTEFLKNYCQQIINKTTHVPLQQYILALKV